MTRAGGNVRRRFMFNRTVTAAALVAALTAVNGRATEAAADKPVAFPQVHEAEMRTLMETEGASAVVAFVAGFADDEQRRKLYGFGQGLFGQGDWKGKNFDAYIEFVTAGIEEGLRQGKTAPDAETAARRLDFANVLSFNMSADLAECWPGDDLPRERRHFEAGLKAAEDCIRWREELQKGPEPFALAYWAKGMHLLSLGEPGQAREFFEKSLAANVELAKAAGTPTEVGAEAGFGLILSEGYIGIAAAAAGDVGGRARYDNAVAAFRAGAENYADKKDDFNFGIEQLEKVKGKFVK
jgi:hypothetical protein